MISDHFSVVTDLRIPANHSRTVPKTIKYRKLNAINIAAFKADIKNSDLIKDLKTSAAELAQQYNSILSTVIDLRVPLVTKKTQPWITPDILASKRNRRYLDCIWCRSPTVLKIKTHQAD